MNAGAERLLRASVTAGDADLWGNAIRHATVRAALALIEVTDAGVGIPRRMPDAEWRRLAAQQRRYWIRVQLEHGPCLAAFMDGIHAMRDVMRPEVGDILILQTDDLDAVPGLRP